MKLLVFMPMMHIRIMRMRKLIMLVRVSMRFTAIPGKIMCMLVMCIMNVTMAATKPLLLAMNNESAEDILRVKLLSIAQHKQAPAIAREPNQLCCVVSVGHDKTTPPATMRNIPKIIRQSVLSLKKTQANTAVNTAS
jgi:hypothetical protein